MAGPSIEEFIRELKLDAASDEALRAEMVTWKRATLREINEGRGGQVISGSGNGTSFAASLGITNTQWYTILGQILRGDSGGRSSSKTYARII